MIRKLINGVMMVLITASLFTVAHAPLNAYAAGEDAEITQIKNTAEIVIDTGDAGGDITRVDVDAKLMYRGNVVKEIRESFSGSEDPKINLGAFGRWNIEASLYSNDQLTDTVREEMNITADTYNVAFLEATLPTLIFSLKLADESISKDDNGTVIPSIVSLARASAYDWNKLPDNTYACPFIPEYVNREDGSSYQKIDFMKEYVGELYSLNPSSKFIFYFTDCFMYLELPQFIWQNNPIPEEQYSVRLLTDGGLSYLYFKEAYDGTDDANKKHEEMVDYLKTLKESAKNGADIPVDDERFGEKGLAFYVYAMLDVERDAEWWLIRKSEGDTLKIKDQSFAKKVVDDERVTNNYINGLLSSVQEAGREESFKALYKFDDSAFKDAEQRGQKVMMILGSKKEVEEASPLKDYVNFLKLYYGDAYTYFYKGHPGYIPELVPGRREELEEMDLTVLDSSIAAELFIFYHPNIHLSGYTTTTFLNSGTEDTDDALFNITKAEAEGNPDITEYAGSMELFISDLKLSDDMSTDVKKHLDKDDHHYYMVEWNDESRKEFGIYDATDNKFDVYVKGFTLNRYVKYALISALIALIAVSTLFFIRGRYER